MKPNKLVQLQTRRKRIEERKAETRDHSFRRCDECTACCTVMAVHEIGKFSKPKYTPCKHECDGCKIYDHRPEPCRSYECLWLSGAIRDEFARPDRCGIIFDKRWDTGGFKDEIWIAREVWPGAFDSELGQLMLEYLSTKVAVYCSYISGRRKIMCPARMKDTIGRMRLIINNVGGDDEEIVQVIDEDMSAQDYIDSLKELERIKSEVDDLVDQVNESESSQVCERCGGSGSDPNGSRPDDYGNQTVCRACRGRGVL